MSKQPPPALTASTVGPCPTVIQIVGRTGTESFPSTIAPPDHPNNLNNFAAQCRGTQVMFDLFKLANYHHLQSRHYSEKIATISQKIY